MRQIFRKSLLNCFVCREHYLDVVMAVREKTEFFRVFSHWKTAKETNYLVYPRTSISELEREHFRASALFTEDKNYQRN